MKHVSHLLLIAVLSCVASAVAAADAAADFPNRPIRFIAPFVAGGPSDLLSRLLGQKLTESWGQSVVVDNRGSAGGIVGFELGAKAAPDGYTLLMPSSAGKCRGSSSARSWVCRRSMPESCGRWA